MKIRYKIIVCFIFFVSIVFIGSKVNANSINSISVTVNIQQNGDAKVTEVWDTNLTQGTEGYKSFSRLGEKSISEFAVRDDSGRIYETLDSWNTNASFDNKAYKCGINKTSDGIELCWGISKYGNRKYALRYVIKNFVVEYSDGVQGVYFNFININQAIGKAKVIIKSDKKLSLENSRIWSFGYTGKSIFDDDGVIVFESNNEMSSSQYIVGLVRFQEKLFDVEYKNNRISFDDIYDSAMIGTENEKITNDKKNNIKDEISEEIEELNQSIKELQEVFGLINNNKEYKKAFIIFIGSFIVIIFIIIKRKWIFGSKEHGGEVFTTIKEKKLIQDVPYYREIPCNGDILRAYWVCIHYNLKAFNTLKKGIIGAIFLKWIKEEKISICKTKKGIFSIKDKEYAIDFRNIKKCDNIIEQSLLDMVLPASGHNKILEAKEFKKWSRKNCYKLQSWFNAIGNREQNILIAQGAFEEEEKTVNGMLGRKRTIKNYRAKEQFYEDAVNLKGLEKYLKDYSSIEKKEAEEVKIWEEYLIFAHLMGIAKIVEEQFKKLYPDLNMVHEYTFEEISEIASEISEEAYLGMERGLEDKERESEDYSSSSYSHDYSGNDRDSGGGGDSYSSGGGSAGGSSSGGFR